MKILITGGTVFASRYASEYFVKKGNDVSVLNRGSRPQPDGVKHICADRRAQGDTLKYHSFDAVVDVTAYNSEDIAFLLDGLGDFGTYVMVSSSAVYPETLALPFREDMKCGENKIWGAYGTDKLAAEKLLIERVPQAYIIRPPYLCGKMNNLYREAFAFDCAERSLPFFLPRDGKLKLQFFDIEDMCRFIEILITDKPERHIFNVGNKDTVTAEEWVNICYSTVNKRAEFRYVREEVFARKYFPFYDYEYRLDVTNMLDLMPTTKTLTESLVQSYQWYVSNKDKVIKRDYYGFITRELMQR